MKTIIDGKKYDTDTAKKVCSARCGNSYNPFTRKSERIIIPYSFCNYQRSSDKYTLYQKQNGEFFSIRSWNEMGCDYDTFIKVTEAQAKKFSEYAMNVEEYEDFWGKVEE